MEAIRKDTLDDLTWDEVPDKHRRLVRLVDKLVEGNTGLHTRKRRAYFTASRHFTPAVVADTGKYQYLVSTRDYIIGNFLFNYGAFEVEYLHTAFRALNALGYKDFRDKMFLDIGANIGSTSVVAMHEYGFRHGLLFEPEPFNYKALRCNLILNDLESKTQAFPYALSNEETELVLGLDPDNWGNHRVVSGAEIDQVRGAGSAGATVVKAVRLDTILSSLEIPMESVGFVWMDAQGHEAHVLEGATRLLESDVPLQMEFWPDCLRLNGGLDRLLSLVKRHYTHFVDVREMVEQGSAAPRVRDIAEVVAVEQELLVRKAEETDLILFKRPRSSGIGNAGLRERSPPHR